MGVLGDATRVIVAKGKKAVDVWESILAFERFLKEIAGEVRAKHGYHPKIETIVMDTEGGSTTTFGYRKSMVDAELIARDIKLIRLYGFLS